MPEFKIIEVEETPYLYAEGSSSMDPKDISAAMGAAYKHVLEFMQTAGIAPDGPAMSVYYDYDPNKMSFRAGFRIARDDMAKAKGDLKADVTPAGRALHFVHEGPYATLRDDYALMMQYVADQDLKMSAPSWEVYVNEPDVTPQADLRTECYLALA